MRMHVRPPTATTTGTKDEEYPGRPLQITAFVRGTQTGDLLMEYDIHPNRFDPALISEPLRPVFARPLDVAQRTLEAILVATNNTRLASEFDIGYTIEADFNACAYALDGRHIIDVSAATPALLLALFFEVLGSTNPFSTSPDEPPVDDAHPGDFLFPQFLAAADQDDIHLASTIDTVLRDAMPPEKWQRLMALALAELATVFVFSHEIGHIVLGHTGILADQRNLALMELRSTRESVPGRVSRAWELAADQSAFGMVWSYAVKNRRTRTRFLHYLRLESASDPILELAGRLCYAISFVFFLLGQNLSEVDAQGSHPSTLVRVTFLIALAQSILGEKHPSPGDRAYEVVTQAHNFAEAAWNRLGLEFGKNSFSERIEDLPLAVTRSQRHMDQVRRRLGAYAWARPSTRR